MATGSAGFGSQDPPCGSELSCGVEAVEQEWMVTWHLLSPLLFVSCRVFMGKARVTCSASRTWRTEYILMVGRREKCYFLMFDPALGGTRGERGQV